MRLFKCQHCEEILYFENRECVRCGHRLGYAPERDSLLALEPAGDGWRSAGDDGLHYRFCANAEHDACNWLVQQDAAEAFCLACRHNHTIPDISAEANLARWRVFEIAKHRLFYTMLHLKLHLETRADNPDHGLEFHFVDDPPDGTKVLTGHDEGVVIMALREASSAERERVRTEMGEPYRTVIGHFRHEVGHYFWDRLIRDAGRADECRAVFGDERKDYTEALNIYYQNGAPCGWQSEFVSEYATSHPWEDFAETWAHYLHIVDTLETAAAFGLRLGPKVAKDGELSAAVDYDPHANTNTQELIDSWLPLTFALNNLNRSMGLPDLYPFILTPAVIAKIDFINKVIHADPAG